MTVSTVFESLYFEVLYTDSKLQRFKSSSNSTSVIASLHSSSLINMSGIISDDLMKSLEIYRVCEDALVYFWYIIRPMTWGTCWIVIWRNGFNGYINSICPSSGRFVYCTDDCDRESVMGVLLELTYSDCKAADIQVLL